MDDCRIAWGVRRRVFSACPGNGDWWGHNLSHDLGSADLTAGRELALPLQAGSGNQRPTAPSIAGIADFDTVRRLLDVCVDAVVVISATGIVQYFNPSAQALLGWTPDEIVGRNVSALMPHEEAAQHDERIARYLRERVPHVIGLGRDVYALHRNGSAVPVSLAVCELPGSEGPCFVGFLRDLSDRYASEQANSMLAQFTQESPDPILRVTASGEVAYSNLAGRCMLADLGCPVVGPVPSDWRDLVQFVLQAGQDPELLVECGTRTLSLRFVPNTAAGHANIYGRDVTERAQLEQRIRDTDARLAAVLESAGDGILMVSSERRIEVANRAAERMFGRPRRMLIGVSLDEVLHLPGCEDLCSPGHTSESCQRSEALVHRADGTEFYVELTVTSIASHGRGFTIVMRDVTDRKKLEREARQLQETLVETARRAGQFEVATGVLHNVGNVLNSINVSTTLLTEQLQRSELHSLQRAVDSIPPESDLTQFFTADPRGRLLPPYLVNAIRTIAIEYDSLDHELRNLAAKIEHVNAIVAAQQSYTRHAPLIQRVSPAVLFDEALAIIDVQRHAEIEFAKSYASVPDIETDKHRALEILINLLTNAIQAVSTQASKSPRIELAIEAEANQVALTVADNGLGIPADRLTRIFSYGFTTKPQGHGFGLHSSALTARALGGTLSVHSAGAGQGARFTLWLPIAPADGNNT